MMKKISFVIFSVLVFAISGCKAAICPEDSVKYVESVNLMPLNTNEPQSQKESIQIGNKEIEFDRVIHGPICNDTWKGTVYVACDVQVVKWLDTPKFLDGCNLTIEPDTVVYVALHNDAPYYKGCTECH
jgi:hypothetical protein